MAARPRVGVSGNGKRWSPSWWCLWLGLTLAGARAVRISVRHTPENEPLDALIISGGDDIAPEHYDGQITHPVRLDPARDRLEIEWIKRAIAAKTPLLGICRGAQLINVVLGGDLHQDIRHLRVFTSNRPGLLPTKRVHLEAGSKLAQITGASTLRVNSLHHQAVRRSGRDLHIVGHDRDNIAQALESLTLPIIGVQWHPEYLLYHPRHFALFRWLLRARSDA